MNLVELLVGTILGAVFGYLFPKWYEDLRHRLQKRNQRQRQSLLDQGVIYDWLLTYYRSREEGNSLFDCRIGGFQMKLPFLTTSRWQTVSSVPPEGNVLLEHEGPADEPFEIDKRLIRKRRQLGQRLFNEPTLYLDQLEERNGSLTLHVRSCQYFQMITLLAGLEEETFKAARRKAFGRVPLRDASLRNLARARQLARKPFSIGCVAAVAIRTIDSYEVLIQTRAHSTITFGGTKSCIPNFGLMPAIGAQGQTNLLFYNFLKEYCEELFSYDQLIEVTTQRRADPCWFYSLSEAQELLERMEDGEFTLESLGFGFDALNGTATIALLAMIDDIRFSANLKRKLCANWEVARQTLDLTSSIEFVDYRSPKLETWLRENKYHFGSAFTLSRAIDRLDQLSPQQHRPPPENSDLAKQEPKIP
jgi:hypothetical protein